MTGEQLSASLAAAGRRVSDWFSGLPVKKLHNGVCGALAIWVLYGLVQLVITFIPSSSAPAPAQPGVSADVSTLEQSPAVDIAALQALNLFGAANAVPEPVASREPVLDEEELNAKKTRLNLSLEGIVYSPIAEDSAAVIVHSGKQELFHVEDKIPVGNNVTLARVLLDRVILDNNGTYESLWLYDEEKEIAQRARRVERPVKRERVADMRDDDGITDMAENYRERLLKNPASLAEVIRITPAQEEGQMIGYRISPGKDRAQFERLGLKTNDIVTSINGIELNEPSNALEVYKLMRTATEASFTIDRNGQSVEILVSLSGD